MSVKVLYFAALRERRGRSEEFVEVAAGSTVADLYARLFPPGISASPVAFTRNRVVVAGDTLLQDGDEVAFLPPLGGG